MLLVSGTFGLILNPRALRVLVLCSDEAGLVVCVDEAGAGAEGQMRAVVWSGALVR